MQTNACGVGQRVPAWRRNGCSSNQARRRRCSEAVKNRKTRHDSHPARTDPPKGRSTGGTSKQQHEQQRVVERSICANCTERISKLKPNYRTDPDGSAGPGTDSPRSGADGEDRDGAGDQLRESALARPDEEDPVMKWQDNARTQIVHRGDLAVKSPAVVRLLAQDLPSAIAPDAGKSRPARPVPPWRTRYRPEPCPAADIAQRFPATAHRSPEPCE